MTLCTFVAYPCKGEPQISRIEYAISPSVKTGLYRSKVFVSGRGTAVLNCYVQC